MKHEELKRMNLFQRANVKSFLNKFHLRLLAHMEDLLCRIAHRSQVCWMVMISEQQNRGEDHHQNMSFKLYKNSLPKPTSSMEQIISSSNILLLIGNALYRSKQLYLIPTSMDQKEVMSTLLQEKDIVSETFWINKMMFQNIQTHRWRGT